MEGSNEKGKNKICKMDKKDKQIYLYIGRMKKLDGRLFYF